MLNYLVTILLLNSVILVESELEPNLDYVFSSYALQRLVVQEQDILPKLINYLEYTERKLTIVREYITDAHASIYENSEAFLKIRNSTVLDSDKLFAEVSSHPLKSFRLLNRMDGYMDAVVKEIMDSRGEEFLLSTLKNSKTEHGFPTAKDVRASQNAVMSLSLVYNLTVEKLAAGNLNGIETHSGLDALAVFEIGYYALRSQVFTLAFQYFDTAFQLAQANKDETLISRIKSAVDFAIRAHDERLERGDSVKNVNVFHFQKPLIGFENDAYRTRLPVSIMDFLHSEALSGVPDIKAHQHGMETQLKFDAICQGQDLRSPFETKDLTCNLVSGTHPFFVLQPLQIEFLNRNPDVLQIYNVLTDNQMKTLRAETEPRLIRSRVHAVNETDQIDNARTSSNTWIQDYEPNSPFNFITKRVERITGLGISQLSGTEELQVANYMPGGFYGPHFDASDNPELSDVQMGGGTGFPKLGFGVQPVKGSGVFWYNLRSDGTLDQKSLHGGCPLLYGLKYIANKWIRSNDQTFRRKCKMFQEALNSP